MELDEKRNLAKKIFEDAKGDITIKEISEKIDVNINTIKSWKRKDNWKSDCRGAPIGNQYAIGNKDGGAPRENINALKNGKYRKYISKTTGQIINDLKRKGATPIDILRENIYIAQGEVINRISLMKDADGNLDNLRESINAFNKISKMVKEYDDLTGENYSLKIEEKKLKIKKLKTEVNKITGEDEIANENCIDRQIDISKLNDEELNELEKLINSASND